MQYIQLQGQNAGGLDTPINGAFNLFIDTSDRTIKVKDENGNLIGGGGASIAEVNYLELYDLWDGGDLTPGQYYKITDYQTCYDQPDFAADGDPITTGNYKSGSVEPLVVFATSDNTLSPYAYQPGYPKDSIKYDISFYQTEVTNGLAKGRIIERIDEWGNRTDYDHRDVLFRRYDNYYYEETDIQTGTLQLIENIGEVTGSGSLFEDFNAGEYIAIAGLDEVFEIVSIQSDTNMIVTGSYIPAVSEGTNFYRAQKSGLTYKQNNISNVYTEHPTFLFDEETIIGNYIADFAVFDDWSEHDFLLPNNVFGEDVLGNRIGNEFMNNTFNSDVEHNVIGNQFQNNTIYNTEDFTDNVIGNNFRNNLIICDDFNDNVIGDSFYDNKIFGNNDFVDNQIGVAFNNNTIYSDFGDNKIGNSFYDNILSGSFTNNSIGNEFYENIAVRQFNGNTIGNEFFLNTIANYFNDNRIGNEFENNTIGDVRAVGDYYFEANIFGNDHKGNLFLEEFYSNTFKDYGAANEFNGYTESNSFGSFVFGNTISGSFTQNVIGFSMYENTIGQDFRENKIGNSFSGNTIGEDFENNQIGNDFIDNTIGNLFSYNTIGHDFRYNNVADDFGFGGEVARGNKIGNCFQSNTIGEYFYDNQIADLFENNTIGDYFQLNNVSANDVNNIDFTTNYGNILATSIASNATNVSNGTYTAITGSNISGSGVGATFDISITDGVFEYSINNGGKFYAVNDAINVLGTSIGGATPADDIVFNVTQVSLTPVVYTSANANIVRNYNNELKLTYIGTSFGIVSITGSFD